MMRVSEFADIAKRLSIFYTDSEADRWMKLPHQQLNGRRPIDCEYQEVLAVIDRLESGAYL